MNERPAREALARFVRFWFWTCCVHSWTLTYGNEPRFRVCTRCRCVAVSRKIAIGWRLLRRKDRSLVYWYGPHRPSGEAFEQHGQHLGHVDDGGGWAVVARNERKIAEALS
jgi:hypothetical protein